LPAEVVQNTRAKYVEAYNASRASLSTVAERLRVRVLIRPGGDPRPARVRRRARLPALGYEDVENVHVGRLIELDVGARAHT